MLFINGDRFNIHTLRTCFIFISFIAKNNFEFTADVNNNQSNLSISSHLSSAIL